MRYIVLLFIALIFIALIAAGVFLVRDRGRTKRTVNALTVRIGLSVTLFLILMISYKMGWIKPPLL
ncbi:MAG TPA: twin transmembrane helix small protein [Burkholderiales bacterium]|nr:twin transmembrane helix small protein [Burkholderiales bacterium]